MVWNSGLQLFGGRYIIERKLGEGGVGITYLAKNPRGELRVIKTLREQILNHPAWITKQERLRQDFRDEALRLALCRHPHIVEVENVFDEDNLPCMAMDYIVGEDLEKRIIEKGKLPEAQALQYIRQIGDALILVHEKGLLHRDLKPSNIMMRAGKPEAVLIDFGIARQFISGAVLQHTQNFTPGYAPPEQYIPDAERGEYIDVYALAATLYSLLTGELPMSATVRLQNFTMQSPKDLNSTVSDRVNEAIMKGMALNYKFRPQSVQEWLDLLGASPIPPTQPVISSSYTEIRTLTGHSDLVNFVAISSDGQILASGSRDKTIKLWSVTTGREIRTLTSHSQSVRSVAISSDGQILASASWDKTIKLWSMTTGREIRTLTGHSELVNSLAFSSDGQILASASWDKTIKLWSMTTGKKIRTLTGHSCYVRSVAISSDGQILASGSWDKTIKLWSMTTGREICTLTGHSCYVRSVAISSDGQILASGSDDKTIKLWSVRTGREIRTLRAHSDSVNSVAISSDGQILASGSYDKTIKLWEISTGKAIHSLTHFNPVLSVAFSPDGNCLATGDVRGNIKIWRRS